MYLLVLANSNILHESHDGTLRTANLGSLIIIQGVVDIKRNIVVNPLKRVDDTELLCDVAVGTNAVAECFCNIPGDKAAFEARVVQSAGQGGVKRTVNSLQMRHGWILLQQIG